MTADLRVPPSTVAAPNAPVPIEIPRLLFRLGIGLALVTAAASALTAFLPDVLNGPAVMNGSARGTAIVLLVVTVPVMVAAMVWTRRGSAAASLVWLGCSAHVLYQSVLFLFATPFNDLYLLYVAMGSLAIASVIGLVVAIDARRLRTHVSPALNVRPIVWFVWVVVALNGLLWIARAVQGITAQGSQPFLDGTGLPTNPIVTQDLVFWLPMMGVAAWWLWRRLDHGFLVIGAMLVMWLIESATVATDQFLGHLADPASDVATIGGAVLFAVLGVVTVWPLARFFRSVDAPDVVQ